MLDNIDRARPALSYSTAEKLWYLYNISWYFPKFISPLILKILLNFFYMEQRVKYRIIIWRQWALSRRAKKMGVPISQDKTFVALQIFRDLAKNPFYFSKCNSGKLLLEYALVRGQITIDNLCKTSKVFAKGDWKNWQPTIFSDEYLHHALLHQLMSYYLVKSEIPEFEYMLYLAEFDYSELYPFGYQEVRKIYLNQDNHRMLIVMRNGDKITNSDQYWDIAKVYAQSALYYYSLTYGHNWVHVNYPDVVVVKAYSMISNKSTFYKLLEPHIRYVMMTNTNGLSGRPTSRHVGPYFDYIRPEVYNLSTQPELAEGLARRAITFATGEDLGISRDTFVTNLRLNFPHTGFKDSNVPYLKNLYRLYLIVRNFVDVVYTNIPDEHKQIERWKEDILKHFPHVDAKTVNTVDFIATFFWQSAFIHSLDHAVTAYLYFFNAYTPTCMRKPFDLSTSMVLEELYDPIDLLTGWAVGNSFLVFNKSKILDDTIRGLDYKFTQELLVRAQEKFKQEIEDELNLNWNYSFKAEKPYTIKTSDLSTSISF